MKVVVDISYVPKFQSNGHVTLLVFDNVQYCLTDEITLSGLSEPKQLDERCKPYVELASYADESRIIPSTFQEDDGNDIKSDDVEWLKSFE
jgi:hypothetical protein